MRVLLGGVAAVLALSLAPQAASASHHVDCAGPIAPACGVINRVLFCHPTPPCL